MSKTTPYLTNDTLNAALWESSKLGRPTEELGKAFLLLATRISLGASWRNYSYIDDMVSQAVLVCLTKWQGFDLSMTNPFSYFTTIVQRTFLCYLRGERAYQAKIDAVRCTAGLDERGHKIQPHLSE